MPKTRKKKPPVSFTPAPAVAEIAESLIADYHPHLQEHNVRMEYVFRSDTPKKNGKSVAGTARKVTSMAAYFGREDRDAKDASVKPFFCIAISKPTWDAWEPEKRRALIDHELCHCGAKYDGDGNTQLYLIPHDVEEFGAIVDRHGLWQRDVCQFAKSIRQFELPFDADPITMNANLLALLDKCLDRLTRDYVDAKGNDHSEGLIEAIRAAGKRGE